MKKALIIGITGQDGSYLAEHLWSLGYAVHGLVRRASLFNRTRIEDLRAAAAATPERFGLHYGDLNDATSLRRTIALVRPDEIYHLAGQSHVGLSFELPETTCQENGMAMLALLEIVRELGMPVRVYYAASSEIFGQPVAAPQDEATPFAPVSPYGVAKAFAVQMGRVYRASYGLYVCHGIAYNHESPRRGENFVTRKITAAAARIRSGSDEVLTLGNLSAARDWGYAPEYVDAMWRALQAPAAGDYVLATGRSTTVREFAAAAFAATGVDLVFEGEGVAETGRCRATGRVLLRVEPKYFRPAEPDRLVGHSARATTELGWRPSTLAPALAQLMVAAERPRT